MMLPFLWPFEAITLFASFLFLALMFLLPGWVTIVGFLVFAVLSYAFISLRGRLEEAAA